MKARHFFLVVIVFALFGCSKDDGVTAPPSTDNYYLSHFLRNNILQQEYLYNNEKLVQRMNRFDEGDLHWYQLYEYTDEYLTEIESYHIDNAVDILGGYKEFIYDSGLLIEIQIFEGSTEPYAVWKFDYENNKMSRWTWYNDSPDFVVFSGYYDFVYENNNLAHVKGYNSDEEMTQEYSYEYDSKNNAFFYVNTMRYLWDDDYPFVSDNNILSCAYDSFDDVNWNHAVYTYSYAYNDSDFPTSCVRVKNYDGGSSTHSYSFEYVIDN